MIYRLSLVSKRGTVELVNTLHVEAEPRQGWFDDPDPTPEAVAAEVATELVPLYRALLDTGSTFERIACSTVPQPGNPAQVPVGGEHLVNLAGTRSVAAGADDLPVPLCARITWRTGKLGRSFRGRMFLPPLLNHDSLQQGIIPVASLYRTPVGAFIDAIVDANLASGSTWSTLWSDTWDGRFVVYSRRRHQLDASPWASDITGGILRNDMSLLRSRRS